MMSEREALLLPWRWESLDLFQLVWILDFIHLLVKSCLPPPPPPRPFLLLSSPSLTHLSTSIFFFFWRSANSFFLLNEYLYCRGWGVVAKRYDGFCGVILMAYLVANVHGCKKHYKQFTNRIIILLKNKQKARNKRNVNKTKHYI